MRACVRSNTGEGEGEGAMREGGGGIYRREGCVFVCLIRVFKYLVKNNEGERR